jgi:hypothetical protein
MMSVDQNLNLDLVVADALPYRYVRLRGDLLTRYFGGTPSDPNFFEGFDPPDPFAVIDQDIGVFDSTYRSLLYLTTNEIPVPGNFDKYSLPLAGPLALSSKGFRAICCFKLYQIGPNSSLIIGMFDDQLDPLASIAAGNVLAFALDLVDGRVFFRGWYGFSSSPLDIISDLAVETFLDKNLVLEIELIADGIVKTVEFRLFDRDRDLDDPLARFQVSGSSVPTVDRFSISSLGRRSGSTVQPDMLVGFEYVDVEPGLGSVYGIDPGVGLLIPEAKWRPYQDRDPVRLRVQGLNRVFGALSTDGISSTIEAQDTVVVDASRPTIQITRLSIASPVRVPGAVTPPIPKVSKQPGFSIASLQWFATKPGTWTLRANSTSQLDGVEIQRGQYTTPGIYSMITWDFADLAIPDGTYDLTLYLIDQAGLATGKLVGEYLLPFKPVLGLALDVLLNQTYLVSTDIDVLIS